MRSLSLRGAALLACLPFAAMANCPRTSPGADFVSPGVLEMTLVPISLWTGPNVVPADIDGGPDESNFTAIPNKSKAGLFPELDWITLKGRVAPVSGSLATDFRITWRYADVIEVRLNGKIVPLARKDLEKYPNLLARFQQARPVFNYAVISFLATEPVSGGTREEWVQIKIPRNSFVLPAEGRLGISSPAIPDRWNDRMLIRDPKLKGAFLGDAETSQAWRRYASVRCPQALFVGLKVPHDELTRIAQALEEHQKSDEKRDKDYAPANDGKLEAPVPGYARSDAGAQPYELPQVVAEPVTGKNGVGLKVNGRVVWESQAYTWIRKADRKGRFFNVGGYNGRAPTRIVDGRGRVQSVKGHTEFGRVRELDDGSFELAVFDATKPPFAETAKHYGGLPDMSEEQFQTWRSRDGDGDCPRSPGGPGISISTTDRFMVFKGVRLKTNDKLKPVSDEVAYFFPHAVPSRVGERVCKGVIR